MKTPHLQTAARTVLVALLLAGGASVVRAQEAEPLEPSADDASRVSVPIDAPLERPIDLVRSEGDARVVYDVSLDIPGRKIPLTARVPLEEGQTAATLTLSVQEREGRRASSLFPSGSSLAEEEKAVAAAHTKFLQELEKPKRNLSWLQRLFLSREAKLFAEKRREILAIARTNETVRVQLFSKIEEDVRVNSKQLPFLQLGLTSGDAISYWFVRTDASEPAAYDVQVSTEGGEFTISTNRLEFAAGQAEASLEVTANPSRLDTVDLRITREGDAGDRLRVTLHVRRRALADFENNFYVCFRKKIPFGSVEVPVLDGEGNPVLNADGTPQTRREQLYKARWHYITNGLRITLTVALCAVMLGAVLGFLLAVIRTTHDKHGRLVLLNAFAKVYITVIRGTPMTVQLLIAYFIIFSNLNNKVLVAILAFGVNSGAYVAEIIRAGITSIDIGQMEAARSLGLSYSQGMRRIVLPQAIRNVLPALGNEFIVMLKDTSIASFIGLDDLARGGSIIRSQTYQAYIPFLAVASIYLVMVMIFSKLLARLEKHLQKSNA